MSMAWFGPRWDLAIAFELPVIHTPVGADCTGCDDKIEEGESGVRYANGPHAHAECHLRSVLGGVNHQKGLCTCCGGDEPPDPPGMTRREAAQAAWDYHQTAVR